ncbi:hypothetical protein NDA03_26520 [Trichocoleus sp. Lan]|uniref:hypothetical protein n=1 Tax=Trichocoleus sp. Lan TaxID=2933927 RepID=UPI00329861EE
MKRDRASAAGAIAFVTARAIAHGLPKSPTFCLQIPQAQSVRWASGLITRVSLQI